MVKLPVNFGQGKSVPLWIKIGLTLVACIVIPVYWWKLGAGHLLWLSDIALLMTVVALWRENVLLNSMVAVGVLPMELIWNLDFFGRIILGSPFLGFTEYMFDPSQPVYFRSLSLFHILLPPLVVFLLIRWGYDRRAFWIQSLLSVSVIIVAYLFTDQEENINWVFGPGTEPQIWMDPLLYLFLGTAFLIFVVMVPTHFVLKRFFNNYDFDSTPTHSQP